MLHPIELGYVSGAVTRILKKKKWLKQDRSYFSLV